MVTFILLSSTVTPFLFGLGLSNAAEDDVITKRFTEGCLAAASRALRVPCTATEMTLSGSSLQETSEAYFEDISTKSTEVWCSLYLTT